ncbi:unnamed protein product [Leptosia nina]|uniref:Uncharacterized protein n=1 Tax=Leptosia nina TaxID=320188 RepID=A0AAV1IW80_9NEOP
MIANVSSVILKCCSLACVIGAAGLWAGSEVDSRPKKRDEQTLVGGAIWSQLIIPLGLIISMVVEEELSTLLVTCLVAFGTYWFTKYALMDGRFLDKPANITNTQKSNKSQDGSGDGGGSGDGMGSGDGIGGSGYYGGSGHGEKYPGTHEGRPGGPGVAPGGQDLYGPGAGPPGTADSHMVPPGPHSPPQKPDNELTPDPTPGQELFY